MKYMGSKSRIAKDIVPILQRYIDENNIDTYVEPFVGGANVIDKIKCRKRIGFDLNKYLIALLNHVKDGGKLYDEVSKDLYDKARNALHNGFDEFELWEMGNIGFLSSYNGRWFDGGYAKSGYEKTKHGERYRDYYREAKNNLLSQAENLKNITFLCCDYRECAFKDAVIYCDPPYNGTKKFANSIEFDYDEFWEVMREWSKDNIVIISEQSAPEDFKCIWEKSVSRSIKSNDKSRATEKLFVYKNSGVAKKHRLKVSRPHAIRPTKNVVKLQNDYIECGDCLKLMKSIPDKSIDMVLCDLPYGTTKCKWDIALPPKREYIDIELDVNWYSVAVNRVNDEKREQQRSCSCMNGFNGDDKSNDEK